MSFWVNNLNRFDQLQRLNNAIVFCWIVLAPRFASSIFILDLILYSVGSGLNTAQSDGSRPRYVQPLQHRPAPKQAFNHTGQAIPEPVRSHIEPHR